MGLDSVNTVDVLIQIFLLYYIYMCVVCGCVCVYMNYDDSVHIINTLTLLSFNKHAYIKRVAVSDICVNYALQ